MNIFNSEWYLRNNPDVAAAVARGLFTAEQHFELYGRFENRAPSSFFDPVLYLNQNPDVAAAVTDGVFTSALEHFLQHGQNEPRSPSLFFDPVVYLAENPDVAAAVDAGAFSSPLEHFLRHGQNEPRNTSPFFDMKGYLDANPDVAEAAQNGITSAFDHFITYGFKEGRPLGNGISLAQFAEDQAAQDAIQNGDSGALMARVAEIAPFLPTYDKPEGYSIPADIPIPQDFTPVAGEKLVIPENVNVPDELPPSFGTPLAVEFSEAASYTDFIALIREHEDALGVAEDLAKLPQSGGRIDAVGKGVQEVRDLFGDFKSGAEVKTAVTKHIQTELSKQAALNDLYSTEDLDTFVELVTNLANDRADIIDYYSTLATQTDSEAGHLRVDALQEELYTVAMTKLAEAFGDPTEAAKIFEEFQDVRGDYSGSIVTLVNKLYEAHAAADDDVAFLRSVNIADDEAAVLAAIKADPDFAALLEGTAFPDNGGREKAVALGVIETIEKLGVFTDVAEMKSVIGLHISMEQHKADFIAGAQAVQTEGFADTFAGLVRNLADDRAEIIEFWANSNDPEGEARATELEQDPYTIVLNEIMAHADSLGDDASAYWENLAGAFDDVNGAYTGSVVTLINQLKEAHNLAINFAEDYEIGAAFNNAETPADLIALIREHAESLGVAEDLAKLPQSGGRIDAVGLGVKEVLDLFGDFTSVDGIKAAASKHIETELNKQAALQNLYTTEGLETFVELVTNLANDRAGIIDYYSTLATQTDSEAGHLRVDALQEELYTVALTQLAKALEDQGEAAEIFAAFQDVRGDYSGSIVTLVNKLYQAHAVVDEEVAFLRPVNTADDEAAVLAAIKADPDFAALLEGTAFPDNGGREKAVALGVIETIEKLGVFSDADALRQVVDQHIEMEKNKAAFIADAQATQTEDVAENFEALIRDLDLDRDAIIDFWSNAGDPEATARADELKADTYTVVLDQIVSHADTLGENDGTYWADLASAFDDINTEYTGSIVTLIGQLENAHNQVVDIA